MSPEEIVAVTRQTGFNLLSGWDILIIYGVMFLVGLAFFIHCWGSPFLPIHLSPKWNFVVGLASIVPLGYGLMRLLYLVYMLFETGIRRLFRLIIPARSQITCPDCGKKYPVPTVSECHGCPKCGGHKVYCANCGKPTNLDKLLIGGGCEQCRAGEIAYAR